MALKPKQGESKQDFMSRCMDDPAMKAEYPDETKRSAAATALWDDPKNHAEEEKPKTKPEDETPPDGYDLLGVEIFRTGKWNGDVYDRRDLQDIVDAFDKVGFVPPVKLGHKESSGGMAHGWIKAIRLAGDRLVADFMNVPKKVFDAIKSRGFDTVSSEIYWDLERNGRKFRRALKAVALLGAEIPAVADLAPLRSVVNSVADAEFDHVATYSIQVKEFDDMKTIEELTAQVADLTTKLTAAEARATAAETAKASGEADADKKFSEADKARKTIQTELETVRKDLDKAHTEQASELKVLREQMAQMHEDKRQADIAAKVAKCSIPAFAPFFRVLYDLGTKQSGVVKFREGDKDVEKSHVAVIDALVDEINKKAKKLFSETSTAPTDRREETAGEWDDPSKEVLARARKFMDANQGKDLSYSISRVLEDDKALAAAYNSYTSNVN